jgi:MATE family multidrug resistance protein
LIVRPRYFERFGIRNLRRFDRALMWRLFRFGGPSALQMTVTVGAFAVFIMIVGQLGPDAMAATTLAFNVETLAWVPMLGLGMAISTLVGQQLGADRPKLAARATWTGFVISLIYMGSMAVLFLSIPHLLLFGHRAGADPVQFAALEATTVVLLRFVAAYCLLDAMNLIFCSAIKGAGDTMFVLLTTIIAAPLPVVAAWAGIQWGGLGLYWCWTVVTVWVWCLGVAYLLRFLQGKWREMRVIESELAEDGTGRAPGETRGIYGPDEVSVASGEW